MELRVLNYFLAVAREENISAAANALHVTQPTLSRQLIDLEQELGVTLFIRGSRKITLTNEGMLLRKRAEEIISLVQKTEDDLQLQDETIRGDIYIGSGETYAMETIAQVIKEIQEEYPLIRFHLFSGNADDVTEKLDKGLLDFGVLIGASSIEKYHSIELPEKNAWGVLMPKESKLAKKESITPIDLVNLPLIVSRQSFSEAMVKSWIGRYYDKLQVVATYNLIFNASLLVEQRVGYALCLDRLINTTRNEELCFRPLTPKLESNISFIWKRYQIFTKAADLFLQRFMDKINS